MADNGWSFLNNSGKSSNYYGADGSWGYTNDDGSGSYYGADGSWGYKNADGSGSYYGADGSWGYTNDDGSGSYYGADGSYGYKNSDGSRNYYGGDTDDCSCSSCNSYASNNNSESGLGALVGLGIVGAAVWAISKLFK